MNIYKICAQKFYCFYKISKKSVLPEFYCNIMYNHLNIKLYTWICLEIRCFASIFSLWNYMQKPPGFLSNMFQFSGKISSQVWILNTVKHAYNKVTRNFSIFNQDVVNLLISGINSHWTKWIYLNLLQAYFVESVLL